MLHGARHGRAPNRLRMQINQAAVLPGLERDHAGLMEAMRFAGLQRRLDTLIDIKAAGARFAHRDPALQADDLIARAGIEAAAPAARQGLKG
ncbi:hypothetical protein [Bordetella pseudohinzii]|uniref:Uncharacterized protein n=1 Tax=Bordetella pseudohinzii TaxID=1331258 RepID=A0ABM6DFU9_9BORD|nr:hypothetical protein [Bordetella pseudohinzii]ANY16740.1 hypothetical protein BBN53_13105 [Bordetella pseudohinzii]KMM25511.1 hypothetical protein L540_19980 [Bordetella pseudohinzii]KXA76776.1 hypothetical protein AW878_17075 [Bordetella pseudohinzii]KXA76975.1 hypothetical protein AW877_15360 [Bordetella pseudohinzii]